MAIISHFRHKRFPFVVIAGRFIMYSYDDTPDLKNLFFDQAKCKRQGVNKFKAAWNSSPFPTLYNTF